MRSIATDEVASGASGRSSSSSSSSSDSSRGGRKHRSSSSSSDSSSRGKSHAKHPTHKKKKDKKSKGKHKSKAIGHATKQQPGGYPPNPGYPGAHPGAHGYPPNTGYPQAQAGAPGYPQAPGYPGAAPGYAGAAPGYPPSQSSGYPSYPPQPNAAAGYPPAHGGAPGYPPAPGGAPGYPQAPGYAQAPGGYPQAPGYGAPAGAPAGAPGYPQAPGYPSGAPGYGHPGQAPGGYPGAHTATQAPYNETQAPYTAAQSPYTAAHAPYTAVQSPYAAAAASTPMAQPTIRFLANFDSSTDAALLRKAMKGFGTDEASIINVLANRTSEQRQRIILSYTQAYGKDLIKDLRSELGGNFERVVLAMMMPTETLLAEHLHNAMQGLGTNENTLVEILCTRNNHEINSLKAAYQRKYNKPLQNNLQGETSGHFRRLLISMTTGARDEMNTNLQLAPQLAQQLYKAGEGKVGTDEAEFNRILASYSYPLLRAVFEEYKKIKGKSLTDAIRSEFSGDIQNGLLAVVLSIENRPAFFAKCLHDAMAGMGTKDDSLIRLIVTRAEIDLGNIKQEFQRMYKKSLESHIKGDTSGDYKKMLLALVDG